MAGRSLTDHPVVVVIGVLAAVATIVGVLFQIGVLPPKPPHPQTACRDPAISLSRGSGPSGTKVTVRGTGFPSDAPVELRYHTETLEPARTDPSGGFSAKVTIPGLMDPFAPIQVTISATTIREVCQARAVYKLTG